MIKKVFITICLLSQTLLFAQVKVVFKSGNLPTGTVKMFFLAGDFNNWNPGDTTWRLQKQSTGGYKLDRIMARGKYSFKATKGSWDMVECGADGKDVVNREVDIEHDTTIIINIADWKDNYSVQQKKHTASLNVHTISENFDIPQLSRQRRIWIYLPTDYTTSHKKYPVIYMQDGQNLFDEYTAGYGEWGIDEILDKLPLKDQCIIVGVDHGGEYRITEYDPYDSKYGKGRGDDYVDFLAKTLKPYIDSNYRTKKDARHNTVAGSSMGGLISAYAVFKYPDIFGNAGIFSPAFWIAPDIYKYAEQVKLPAKTRFYFVSGDIESVDMVPDMKKMVDILYKKGFGTQSATYTIMKGYKHNEQQWNTDFPAFYAWLINGY